MTNITVISEPLIEKFGQGWEENKPQPETPCSGDGLNMAMAVHRMIPRLAEYAGNPAGDHKVGVFCGLGDDADGKIIRKFMETEGLNTDNVITVEGRGTASYTINSVNGGKERSVSYENRGVDSAMCQTLESGAHQDVANAAIENVKNNTDILVITGIGASRMRSEEAFEKLLDMATAVRKRGGKVIIDFNHRMNAETGAAKLWVDDNNQPLPNDKVRERMDKLYALSSVAFIANDELWPVYSNTYNPPIEKGVDTQDGSPIMQHLMNLTPPEGVSHEREMFFKRGKDGGTLYHKDAEGNITETNTLGNRVALVDRNGGGDNLIGGTVAGLVSGYSLEKSLAIGQRLAGQVIQHHGGVIQKKYLLTNPMIDAATGKSAAQFLTTQHAAKKNFDAQPFVPVFQLTTHNGANTILADAEQKVEAMHKGGIKQFEFLLRGDETMPLDQYIDETLAAIDFLAKKFPDAKFGVGTVSSPERMQKVVENPNVAFIVTAHWPGEEMIKMAVRNGKPIIPTVSKSETVTISEDKKIAAPGKVGTDTLVPERIAKLRELGVDTIKIFDFGAIAKKRSHQETPDSKTMIAAGLVAIAEAIRNSYGDQPVPANKQFYAMTTGGITKDNLPYLAAGVNNADMKAAVNALVRGPAAKQQIMGILENTTVVAGGTFITKDFDKEPNQKSSEIALEQLSKDVTAIIKNGQLGIIANRRPGS